MTQGLDRGRWEALGDSLRRRLIWLVFPRSPITAGNKPGGNGGRELHSLLYQPGHFMEASRPDGGARHEEASSSS